MDFAIPADHRTKIKENEKKKKMDDYLDFVSELKKTQNNKKLRTMWVTDNNCCWCACNGSKKLWKGTWGTGNQRKNWDHPDHSITKIG